MDIKAVGKQIVDASIKIHRALGPGLLESAYQHCLAYELRKRGLRVECEVQLPVVYDGVQIDAGYRLDMLVEGCVIVENKAIARPRGTATDLSQAPRSPVGLSTELERALDETGHQAYGEPIIDHWNKEIHRQGAKAPRDAKECGKDLCSPLRLGVWTVRSLSDES